MSEGHLLLFILHADAKPTESEIANNQTMKVTRRIPNEGILYIIHVYKNLLLSVKKPKKHKPT